MSPRELLAAGRLSAAIKQLAEELKANPADAGLRIFLFELLCFSGDLARARKQLEAVAHASAQTEIAVQRYINLLACEDQRRRVFGEALKPRLLSSACYAEAQLTALDRFRSGDLERARELLEEAEAQRPPTPCRINGVSFEDFKDANDLLGPFAEAVVQNEYCWIPWEAIASLRFQKPRYLRDLMWLPGTLELNDGSAGEAYFPVLYPDTWKVDDEPLKLGRETRWQQDFGGLAVALGQKTFLAGDRDFAILELETLELEHANTYAGD